MTTYNHRIVARVMIEAETPLSVGSGQKGIISDSLVMIDANGLPYIPATSIAGVLRHGIGEREAESFFGYATTNDTIGSKIIFTEAKLVNREGKAIDGLCANIVNDDFLVHYLNLPVRQHVRINQYGSAEKSGKFDEQVVYKGSRFVFDMEMVATEEKDADRFNSVLDKLFDFSFRLGSGTHSGLGEVSVVSCTTKDYDLNTDDGLREYAEKSSNLSIEFNGQSISKEKTGKELYITYQLDLEPKDSFIFSSGFGDEDADMTPVKEEIVTWTEVGSFSEIKVLIPASSVKGAIAHRVAYHYNRLNGYFAGNKDAKVGNANPAVRALFGYTDGKLTQKGGVYIPDVFVEEEGCKDKTIPHVAIDRFTGGGIGGALFSEKTVFCNHKKITLKLYVPQKELGTNVKEALEATLEDIRRGLLPLGGGVNRGNGAFKKYKE